MNKKDKRKEKQMKAEMWLRDARLACGAHGTGLNSQPSNNYNNKLTAIHVSFNIPFREENHQDTKCKRHLHLAHCKESQSVLE